MSTTKLIIRQFISVLIVSCRLFTGFIGPAICLVATGFICDKAGAVTMIVFAVGLSGISMAGWAVNHLDLAPPYAGISLILLPLQPPNVVY